MIIYGYYRIKILQLQSKNLRKIKQKMNKISKNDILFELYDSKKTPEFKDDFSHFGWEGMNSFAFFTYADGYRIAAESIFEKFKKSNGDFSVMDSIAYPLCFNYRHMMELLIKYLHLKYVRYETKDDLIQSGLFKKHILNDLWNMTKKHIEQLQNRASSSVDIEAITHYIDEMNNFDYGSFNMRYPIYVKNKELYSSIAETHLIVPRFHEKMQAFFNAIVQLDDDIDYQIRFDVEKEKINRFIREFEATKVQIENIIELAKKYESIRIKNKADELGVSFFDSNLRLSPELHEARDSFHEALCELSDNQLVLVHALFYNGRDHFKLPNDATEKRTDYVKSAIFLMKQLNISFDSTIIDRDVLIDPFISKMPEYTISWLQKSIDII